jgi:hypothetical protein
MMRSLATRFLTRVPHQDDNERCLLLADAS